MNRNDGWGIRSRDQVTMAAITALALAAIAGSWVYRGGLSGRLIDIDEAPRTKVSFTLDVNSADWPEWTLLPGVGETMAKRIVQDRDERGSFDSHDALLRVKGIGSQTLERMRPFLLPLESTTKVTVQPDVTSVSEIR